MKILRIAAASSATLVVALAAPAAAWAQAWSNKPITIVVPATPGGAIDLAARPQRLGRSAARGYTAASSRVIASNQARY